MSIDRRIYSFQYRLISCYVLLLISLAVYAQSGKERFVGRVVDTETNQSVPFATVRLLALPDSILLVGGATDIQGKFQLAVTIPKRKSILLHISYIGYTSVYRTISVSANNKTPTLGNISLSPESISLNETVVVGQAPMAVTEGDTTVFNASAYRTPEGSMLEELVKQLPGGEIDEDGKLLIHGKEVKKILVDGKEFFSDDPKAALKNLPVEMIEKLKAYERQSDLARLTGIDDGEEEMILDLSVKKNMKRGWMENFMGGYGSKDRYELANTLNRFRDNSQLTVIGNLNNTNNQGFSEMQGESASSSGNLRKSPYDSRGNQYKPTLSPHEPSRAQYQGANKQTRACKLSVQTGITSRDHPLPSPHLDNHTNSHPSQALPSTSNFQKGSPHDN